MMKWSQTQGVIEVELSQPPCNEIGTEMLSAFERMLSEIDMASAHALILHSSTEAGFCAGANLRELHEGLVSRPQEEHAPELKRFLDRIHNVMNQLDEMSLVTIGVIHGVCFGGGFELALVCDQLIAETSARFCFPELRLGIIPCFGGIPRLKREVPNAVVRDLLLTGRSINAKKALGLGLVSQVVREGEGLNVARRVGEQVGKFSSEARLAAKKFIKPIPKKELEEEKEIALRLFQRPVVKDALEKFVNDQSQQPYLP